MIRKLISLPVGLALLYLLIAPTTQVGTSLLKKNGGNSTFKDTPEYKSFEKCLEVLTPYAYNSTLLPDTNEESWALQLKEETKAYLSSILA